MACCLASTKPLSEPMLEYCYLDPQEQTIVKFNRNSCFFIQENTFENVVWKMVAFLSQPQCDNSLRPNNIIYQRRSLSTLA